MSDLCAMSLTTLAGLIRAREVSALEVADALIARAESVPNLFVTPTFEAARDAARAADRAREDARGALHGVPLVLKDAIDVAGLPTTACSRLYEASPAARDAPAWARLRAAGAILMGKVHCAELCLGAPGPDDAWPWPGHPVDAARSPGGSSSGSAVALARGVAPGALGTDTAGSVRIPAAFCGVAGLKPSDGFVSRKGVFPLSPTLDQVGPMARRIGDCALLLEVLTGRLPTEVSGGVRGLVVGVPEEVAEAAGPVAEALGVCTEQGARVVREAWPDLAACASSVVTIMLYEAYRIHGAALTNHGERVSAITRARIGAGAAISPEAYGAALDQRVRLAQEIAEAMAGVDAVILPVTAREPPVIAGIGALDFMDAPMPTTPANIAGLPAVSVPCGVTATGLPRAVQVLGGRGRDGAVLRVARAIEAALGSG